MPPLIGSSAAGLEDYGARLSSLADGIGGTALPWYIDTEGTTEQLTAIGGNRGEGAMSGQVVDWLTQGVTLALVIYFGLHLRSQLRTLKTTVETQKLTIEAQAEQMKAQSTVLQDFERHSKLMKQMIDTVDAPAMLDRMQKYRQIVDIEVEQLAQQLHQLTHDKDRLHQFAGDVLISFGMVSGQAMCFLPHDQRMRLVDLPLVEPHLKRLLQILSNAAPYLPGHERVPSL
jgi:hypothetical protein